MSIYFLLRKLKSSIFYITSPVLWLGVLLCLVLFPKHALSQTEPLSVLSQNWQWKKLLQYNERDVSEVSQREFFISSIGNIDKQAELVAFIEQFTEYPQDVACRYPARYLFIRDKLSLPDVDLSDCQELMDWMRTEQPKAISLVFADGYLKNPASFHGHLFIKIDGAEQQSINLFDNSLNFGAIVPNAEDPISYMVKGLVGGYRARYSAQPFYRHNISYAQEELRNLWHYRLALNQFDTWLLALHLFELRNTDYTYYFMSKNCAYYVARALELVLNQHIVSANDIRVIPSEIVARLMAVDDGAKVQKLYLEKSLQAQFQSRYRQLTKEEERVFGELLATDFTNQSTTVIESLEPLSQQRVLVVLNTYFAFRVRQAPDDDLLKLHQKRVMKKLLSRPLFSLRWQHFEPMLKPHDGQLAALFRLARQNYNHASFGEVTLRPTYYDRLQPAGGRPAHSAMSMAELGISFRDEKIALEKLWLVNISTLNLSNTGIAGDGGWSWGLRFGAERFRLRDFNARLTPFVSGEIGIATRLNDHVIGYALVNGQLHGKMLSKENHSITSQGRLGLEWQWQYGKGICEISQPIAITSTLRKQTLSKLCKLSFWVSKDADIRLSWAEQNERLISAQWSYYF